MRLTFRQGIARYQTDIYATPTFLQKAGNYVDLNVSPDPTIVIFAHKTATYVIEETKSVARAWGPFPGQATVYLYWDINLLDASLTRGFTTLPQIVTSDAPVEPAIDQHWYDTTHHQMKVWNGNKWIDKLRVFAATYSSQAVIQPFPLGTQAGELGNFDGGNLILDSYNMPLRQSDGTFVTSASSLTIINTSANRVKFESEIVSGMAAENIPKFSFVCAERGRRLLLARSNNWRTRVIGVATEDLYESEVGNIEPFGLVRNEQWHWSDDSIGKPVFCGTNGEIQLEPPTEGVLQICGYVYADDSIVVDIKPVTILQNLNSETIIMPLLPPGRLPIANFTATGNQGFSPLVVEFKDTSLYNPSSWEWDFNNDGTIDSTQQNPTFTYSTPGRYTVKLKVTNAFGSAELVQTGVVNVEAAPASGGTNANLSIQLMAPLQVDRGQEFVVTVTTANSGFKEATRVSRTMIIDDFSDGSSVTVTAKPIGSTVNHASGKTILSFPQIATLSTGQTVANDFSIKVPNKNGTVKIQAGVVSPEVDSELGDNVSALSIRIK